MRQSSDSACAPRALSSLLILGLAVVLAACGGECIDDLPLECAPLYEPVFSEVFSRTFHPTCGVAGAACHAREGANGGLVFATEAEALGLLLAPPDGDARVIAGDAACSPLVVRIESIGDAEQMPPGTALQEEERCAIRTWIQQGAKP